MAKYIVIGGIFTGTDFCDIVRYFHYNERHKKGVFEWTILILY